MPTVSYPFDDTGLASTNLVSNEDHTVSEVNAAPYRIIIPDFAPLYLHNLSLVHVAENGTQTPLSEGVDYYPVLPYMAASRSTGQSVYGGISIINAFANGIIRLASYQTVGGGWCADKNFVYQKLLESQYNRRTTWWDLITNIQELFPPSPHNTNTSDIAGHIDLIAKLEEVRLAILQAPQNPLGSFAAHLLNQNNPHNVTKTTLGLGNVQNFPPASDQEVLNRTATDKTVTLRQIVMLLDSLGL